MPRFRFNWANISPELAEQVARDLGISGPPADGLRAAYGARPKEDFIANAWQILLNRWLSSDPSSAAEIAATLRERGVGEPELADDLDYLRSCRNTSGLRRVVLPVFIALGEVSPGDRELARPHGDPFDRSALQGGQRIGAAPADPPRPASDGAGSPPEKGSSGGGLGGGARIGGDGGSPTPPAAAQRPLGGGPEGAEGQNPVEHLRSWLVQTVSEMFETEVSPDDDGDIPVPYGSAGIFIAPRPNPLHVEIFSQLVTALPASPELLESLNHFNSTMPFAKVFHHTGIGGVCLTVNLPANGLSLETLGAHLTAVARLADHLDTSIKDRFGGDLFGQDESSDEQSI